MYDCILLTYILVFLFLLIIMNESIGIKKKQSETKKKKT